MGTAQRFNQSTLPLITWLEYAEADAIDHVKQAEEIELDRNTEKHCITCAENDQHKCSAPDGLI